MIVVLGGLGAAFAWALTMICATRATRLIGATVGAGLGHAHRTRADASVGADTRRAGGRRAVQQGGFYSPESATAWDCCSCTRESESARSESSHPSSRRRGRSPHSSQWQRGAARARYGSRTRRHRNRNRPGRGESRFIRLGRGDRATDEPRSSVLLPRCRSERASTRQAASARSCRLRGPFCRPVS